MHPLDRAFDSLKRDFDASCSQQARAAREAITAQLNQLLRRLRQYETENEWIGILADSASAFASELAIFEVQDGQLKLRAQRGLSLPVDLSISIAPGIANAIDTKDPVVALRTASEVGPELAHPGDRARLIPILNHQRVVALLFAAEHGGETEDSNALELVAGIASAVLERQSNAERHGHVGISNAPVHPKQHELPSWGDLSASEQTLHLRAQRFARVAVAEAQLSRPEACAAGRQTGDVYLFLKTEIEKARETYQRQFMVIPSMVDYFHLEIVRVIANNDESLMGVEYPGAMV